MGRVVEIRLEAKMRMLSQHSNQMKSVDLKSAMQKTTSFKKDFKEFMKKKKNKK